MTLNKNEHKVRVHTESNTDKQEVNKAHIIYCHMVMTLKNAAAIRVNNELFSGQTFSQQNNARSEKQRQVWLPVIEISSVGEMQHLLSMRERVIQRNDWCLHHI